MEPMKQVTNGFLLGLSRDHAKQLFAARGDDALKRVVSSLKRELEGSNLCQDCGRHWDAIHRCLSDGTLNPSAGEVPLNHCILGGRQMLESKNTIVAVVRPDLTRHVARELNVVSEQWFRDRYYEIDPQDYGRKLDDDDLTEAWRRFEEIRDFYQNAAQQKCAIAFATV